jgi:hypothetical protein
MEIPLQITALLIFQEMGHQQSVLEQVAATYIQFGYNDYLSAANNYTGIFNVHELCKCNYFQNFNNSR